jgi:hypothetical protein
MKNKQELQSALVQILELARNNRDFADDPNDAKRWDKVAQLSHEALDKPSLADLERLKQQQ